LRGLLLREGKGEKREGMRGDGGEGRGGEGKGKRGGKGREMQGRGGLPGNVAEEAFCLKSAPGLVQSLMGQMMMNNDLSSASSGLSG